MPFPTYCKTLMMISLSVVFYLLHFDVNACETYTNLQEEICEGQSYSFNGKILNTAGVYVDTLKNAEDCDSIITLNLAVIESKRTQLTQNICSGQSFTVGNQSFSNTGQYTVTLTSAAGCDSIVSLNLTVHPVKNTNLIVGICQGQSFTVGNQTFNSTGIYTVNLVSAAGCDSIVRLNLTVNEVVHTQLTRSICQGGSVTIGNQTFTSTGQYNVTLTSALDCDSIVHLNLVVNEIKNTQLTRTICQGQSFTVGNQNFSTTGQYNVTLTSAAGCDSIVHLNLIVNPIAQTNLNRQICNGDSITIGGQTFSATGQYNITLTGANGCDSIVRLNLTVVQAIQNNIVTSVCAGKSYTVGNQVFTTSGQYVVALQSASGCDSIVRLNLTVLGVIETNLNRTICAGKSFAVGNQTFSQSGQYQVVLTSAKGCDSTVQLNLTVLNPIVRNINTTICEGQVFVIGTQQFSTSGNHSVVLTAVNGCDSSVNLQLTVAPASRVSLNPVICAGQRFTVGNKNYTVSGTYIDTLINQFFCDSIITTVLTVKQRTTEQITRTICPGQSVTVGQNVYTQPGTYRDTLASVFGCDSIIVLRLNVQSQITFQQTINICDGQTYSIGNNVYTASGTYLDTLVSSGGCDSIVTTRLFVRPVYQQNVTRAICQGDSLIFGSNVIKTAGQYIHKFSSVYSCDSTVNLTVEILRRDSRIDARNSCAGQTIRIEGKNYTRDTTFLSSHVNSLGCDSTIEYRLRFYPTYQQQVQRSICMGAVFQNVLIEKDTTLTLRLKSVFGCDSIVTVNVKAVEKILTGISSDICPGATRYGVQIYKDTVITRVLASQLGCDSIVVDTISVFPDFELSTSTDTTVNPGSPVSLFASGAVSYEWSTGSTAASIVVRPNVTTVYTVKGFSALGCEKEVEITVYVNACQITAPTYFTPNGDGSHDKWKTKGTECLSEFALKIINRGGEVIYETTQTSESWDGTYKGKPAPDGVYFYILEGIAAQDDKVINLNGYIHLQR